MNTRAAGASGHRAAIAVVFAVAWNLFIVSPVLLFELGLRDPSRLHIDKLALFAMPASLLWLAVVQLLVRRQVIAHLVMLPFSFCVGVDLYLVYNYGTRLNANTISMLFENIGHSGDFIELDGAHIVACFLVLAAFLTSAAFAVRPLVVRARPRLLAAAVAAVVLLYGGVIARQVGTGMELSTAARDVMEHDRNSPFSVLPQMVAATLVFQLVQEHKRTVKPLGATRAETPAEPETYVLVLGESSRPDHWGLYGYPRETSPRLAREPNLIVYRDVMSQAAITMLAVPLIMTRTNVNDVTDPTRAQSSIVTAMREAGFHTRWLSTQHRDQWTGAVNTVASEAIEQRYLDREYDGALIDLLRRPPTHDKTFIVLHTRGSHFKYEDCTPREDAVFGAGMINEYDDSIRYTDHVLAEVIAALRERPGLTAMLYVSDHGENLEDDERALLGHFQSNEYDLPVPMVLWLSDAWAARWPDKAAAARNNAATRVSTRAVFHTVADLAALAFPEPQPRLSVLGALEPAPRMALRAWKAVDIDAWLAASGTVRPLDRLGIPVAVQGVPGARTTEVQARDRDRARGLGQ